MSPRNKQWHFRHLTARFRGGMMIKFTLLTFVTFAIALVAIPEVWLTHPSATQHPTIQTDTGVTFETTDMNGQAVVTIPVVGESQVQFIPDDNSARTVKKQVQHPDLSDRNVL